MVVEQNGERLLSWGMELLIILSGITQQAGWRIVGNFSIKCDHMIID